LNQARIKMHFKVRAVVVPREARINFHKHISSNRLIQQSETVIIN